MADTEFYRARQAFATSIKGAIQVVPEGHLVAASDPLFKKCRDQFVPIAEYLGVERTVEATTAEPGEKRHVRIPRGPQTRKEHEDASPPPA